MDHKITDYSMLKKNDNIKILLITICALLVTVCKASDRQILLSDKNSSILVNHQDMEISENCPSINLISTTLKNNKPKAITNLCKIRLEDYPEFDARKDFSYIDFMNYQFNNNIFTYDIDASLLTGSHFIAQCSITIEQSQMSAPVCIKIKPTN
jgi:hypothetical protein